MDRAEDIDIAAMPSDQRLRVETSMKSPGGHRARANRTVKVARHGLGSFPGRTRA